MTGLRSRLARLERARAGYPPETIAAALSAAEAGDVPADPRLAALVRDLLAAVEAIDATMAGEDMA